MHSLPGPPSTPELGLYIVSPSNREYSYRDYPSHVSGQNLEYSPSQSPASILDSYAHQRLHAGIHYIGNSEVDAPSHPNPNGHALSGADMLTRFDIPLTESGLGLLQDANPRSLYGYFLAGSDPRVGLSNTPDHRPHPLSRPFLGHDPAPHPLLTSHNDYFSASPLNWMSTVIPGTTSDSTGELLVGSIVGPKLTPFNIPNGPSKAAPELMRQEQIIAPPIAIKTASSPVGGKEAQSNDLTRGRGRGAVARFLGTVSNPSQRSTRALPYQRALCKKDLSYTPEYLRAALSRLLKIVGKSLFVSQNTLEPTIGSGLANNILIEVHDRTGVWLGDKVSEGESLYFLFIDRTANLSLICGHDTRTSDRALGHIRSMLDHRPFPCLGKAHGCNSKKCSGSADRPFRFFTEALRDDHIRRQGLQDECITCGAMIRRGGMNRHVRRHAHPETVSTPEEGSGGEIS